MWFREEWPVVDVLLSGECDFGRWGEVTLKHCNKLAVKNGAWSRTRRQVGNTRSPTNVDI